MKKSMLAFISLMFSGCVSSSSFSQDGDALQVVPHVDIERYMGTWYEIASIPQRFQKGCVNSQADYSLLANGDVRVVNSCRLNTPDGKVKTAEGTAWVIDKQTNAKLKVQFFWPFRGNYWIIELDDSYNTVVVGDPSREYLWILSRQTNMDDNSYQDLLDRIKNTHKYDVTKIVKTRVQE